MRGHSAAIRASGATLMLILGYCATPAAAAPVLDASCGPSTGSLGPALRNAQTFTVQTTGTLVRAQMEIIKTAEGGDWTMTLYTTDAGGIPTNNGISSTGIPNSTVPTGGPQTVTGVFSPPPSVVAGQTYALGISRSPNSGYALRELFPDPCPGGEFFSSSTAGNWTAGGSNFDFAFTTFVEPAPTPAQPGDSNPPSVTITDGPKDKTKKKTATFTFAGTDARAVAGFQCKLDSGAFATCTSPHTVNVKKGKHTFEVRATDDSGNTGPAASDNWKVKKKNKKK